MKYVTFILFFVLTYLWSAASVFAATTPTPTPVANADTDTPVSGNAVLNTFVSGFDWISTGLIFNTPAILDQTIKLNDGTTLTGLSEYRNIFYDIAIPFFVIIISFIALSHITNDNSAQ